jgi:NADPH:quinone reductase-like Zn-dependent oxidoreductase
MTDLPVTMRGVWLIGHGDMDKLDIRQDIPVPVPGPREVLVSVAAAGVNNTDINTRIAWYSKKEGASDDAGWSGQPLKFPRIQGADVCGRIVAVGPNVNTDRIGERVLIEPCIREANGQDLEKPWYFGSECDGGFSEFTVVASRHAYKIESKLSDLDVRTLYLKDLSLFGCTVLEPEVFSNLTRRIEQGEIKPVVAQSFALEDICEAQTLFLKKQHVGKIVLKI